MSVEEVPIQDKYRTIFSSGTGLDVLADILSMCHFGATLDPDNSAQIAEYNVGISILVKCGMLRHDNMKEVIQSIMGVR